jgi:hypothetical protein
MFSTYPVTEEVNFPFMVGKHPQFRQFPSAPAVVPASLTATSADIMFTTTLALTGTIRRGTAAVTRIAARNRRCPKSARSRRPRRAAARQRYC